MALINPFVSYTDRSYEQVTDSVISKMPVFVPEITDQSDSNPFIRFIKIFGGLTEQLNYYLDRKAQESYITTCKRFSSAVKIAAQFDYRIKGTIPSSVLIRFYFDNPVTADVVIPVGTEVDTLTGLPFLTIEQKTIAAGTTYFDINANQWVKVISQVLEVSDGSANQVFEIIMPSNIVGQVVDFNIQVSDTTDVWAQVDTLAFSGETDKNLVTRINANNNMEVAFGDGINGMIPVPGPLTVTYYISQGTTGNLAANQLTVIKNPPTVPSGYILKATNQQRASGGTNSEGLADLQKKIPYSFRTLRRAVSTQDYIDIAELAPGVEKAGVIFNCGKTVNIYVAPSGGGIASPSLLANVVSFFDDKRMVTTTVNALSAGIVRLKINISIKVLPNYYNDIVAQAVIDTLVAFGDVSNQDIQGSIALGDLYQTSENTPGVDNSQYNSIVPIPYASIILGTHNLNWNPTTLPGSVTNINWQIKINTSSTYYLFKSNVYVGIFSFSDVVEFDEVSFIVNADTYSIGDTWSFWTYPYNGSVKLQEFSIPTIYAEDITVNATGGL